MDSLADRHRGLIALSGREIIRVTKLWTQTIAAPVLSSALFILVFGLSIGGRIKEIEGYPYKVFIVPRLITRVGDWADTTLRLPKMSGRNVFTGNGFIGGSDIRLSELLTDFPVALLLADA